jgi:hypothetical protein
MVRSREFLRHTGPGQLEKLKAQRASLELQRAQSESPGISAEHVEKSVAEYCAEAAANLASFTNDQWKNLLRTVVQAVTFQGHGIVIRGRIPISDTGDPGAQLPYTLLSQAVNFAPHGCSLISLYFSHSALCFLSVPFRVWRQDAWPRPDFSMDARSRAECKAELAEFLPFGGGRETYQKRALRPHPRSMKTQ